ncbi:MAG: ParB/RepB/Spo0J family partition protein [Treponema sp.]|nr:ParB/RepB/Spo0J family partition protein [Treponema sp.]
MGKLGLPTTAGFNAGKTFYAKPMRIAQIVIDPEIANIFSISDKILENIKRSMQKNGFYKEEPVVLWKGTNILVDGRTKYTAAKALGFEEIPVVEREFKSREDAILYTFERQVLRRNLTGAEILQASRVILDKHGGAKNEGAREIAGRLGVSKATAYQAIKVLEEGTEEDVKAVESGAISIKKAYTPIAENSSHRHVQARLPDSAKFLSSAVILLVQKQQQSAAELLVNHFLRRNEKEAFYGTLPGDIKEKLEGAVERLEDSNGGML